MRDYFYKTDLLTDPDCKPFNCTANMCRGNHYITKSCILGNIFTLVDCTNYSLYDIKKYFQKYNCSAIYPLYFGQRAVEVYLHAHCRRNCSYLFQTVVSNHCGCTPRGVRGVKRSEILWEIQKYSLPGRPSSQNWIKSKSIYHFLMNFDAFFTVFLILLNFGWMVDLAMSIFVFLTKFLIFWHPWHLWVCIRSDLNHCLKQIFAIPPTVNYKTMLSLEELLLNRFMACSRIIRHWRTTLYV